MKELLRFTGYTLATLAMIGTLIGISKMDISGSALVYSAIIIVIVLPVAIGILMARREKKRAVQ